MNSSRARSPSRAAGSSPPTRTPGSAACWCATARSSERAGTGGRANPMPRRLPSTRPARARGARPPTSPSSPAVTSDGRRPARPRSSKPAWSGWSPPPGTPDPRVEGRGFERLRAAGIEAVLTDSSRLAQAATEINTGFFTRVASGRPFVRLKLAASLDGRTALPDGTSRWITGEEARRDVQRWRARAGALLTGERHGARRRPSPYRASGGSRAAGHRRGTGSPSRSRPSPAGRARLPAPDAARRHPLRLPRSGARRDRAARRRRAADARTPSGRREPRCSRRKREKPRGPGTAGQAGQTPTPSSAFSANGKSTRSSSSAARLSPAPSSRAASSTSSSSTSRRLCSEAGRVRSSSSPRPPTWLRAPRSGSSNRSPSVTTFGFAWPSGKQGRSEISGSGWN